MRTLCAAVRGPCGSSFQHQELLPHGQTQGWRSSVWVPGCFHPALVVGGMCCQLSTHGVHLHHRILVVGISTAH